MKLPIISALIMIPFLIAGCGNNKEPNTIIASGTIETIDVTVSSKVNGQIKQFYVKEGDMVKGGQLLLEIDHDLLDIQLRQAEAGVDQASAQLRLMQIGARKEDISQLRIEKLKKRLAGDNFSEIIVALNPTPEGRATSVLVEQTIKEIIPSPAFKITHLAKGIPVGGELEYTDEETLESALEGRK